MSDFLPSPFGQCGRAKKYIKTSIAISGTGQWPGWVGSGWSPVGQAVSEVSSLVLSCLFACASAGSWNTPGQSPPVGPVHPPEVPASRGRERKSLATSIPSQCAESRGNCCARVEDFGRQLPQFTFEYLPKELYVGFGKGIGQDIGVRKRPLQERAPWPEGVFYSPSYSPSVYLTWRLSCDKGVEHVIMRQVLL